MFSETDVRAGNRRSLERKRGRIAKRRQQVQQMYDELLTVSEIAKELGVSERTVAYDIKALTQ